MTQLTNPLKRLPDEIIRFIAPYVNLSDVENMAVVNKLFNKIMSNDVTWHRIAQNLKLVDKKFESNQNYKAQVFDYYRKANAFLEQNGPAPTYPFGVMAGWDPLEKHKFFRHYLKNKDTFNDYDYGCLLEKLRKAGDQPILLEQLIRDFIDSGRSITTLIGRIPESDDDLIKLLIEQGYKPSTYDIGIAYIRGCHTDIISFLRKHCSVSKQELEVYEAGNDIMTNFFTNVKLESSVELQDEDPVLKFFRQISLLHRDPSKLYPLMKAFEDKGFYSLINSIIIMKFKRLPDVETQNASWLIKKGFGLEVIKLYFNQGLLEIDNESLEAAQDNLPLVKFLVKNLPDPIYVLRELRSLKVSLLRQLIEEGDINPKMATLLAIHSSSLMKFLLEKKFPIHENTLEHAINGFYLYNRDDESRRVIVMLVDHNANVSRKCREFAQEDHNIRYLLAPLLKEPS